MVVGVVIELSRSAGKMGRGAEGNGLVGQYVPPGVFAHPDETKVSAAAAENIFLNQHNTYQLLEVPVRSSHARLLVCSLDLHLVVVVLQ